MNPFHGLARITEKMFGTPIMLYIAIDTFDSLKRNGVSIGTLAPCLLVGTANN